METSSWTYTLDFAFLKLILNIFIVKERKMHTLMLQHKYLFIIVTIFLVCLIKNKVLFGVHISCSTFLSTFFIGKLSFANVIFLFSLNIESFKKQAINTKPHLLSTKCSTNLFVSKMVDEISCLIH